jgi:hypothetical protein
MSAFSFRDIRRAPISGVTAAAARAAGTLTIGAGVPTALDTFTVGATVFTWRAGSAPLVTDVLIGGDVTISAANAVAKVNAHPTAGALVLATNNAGIVTFTAILYGTAGNAIALAENGTNTAVSGAFLTGGVAAIIAEPGAGRRILVLGYCLTLDAAGEITWISGTTVLSGAMELLDSTQLRDDQPEHGVLFLAANEPLTALATQAANGYVRYVIVPA